MKFFKDFELKGTVIITLSILFTLWFVPFVPQLKWGSVNITRWSKSKGEIHIDIGPKEKDWVPYEKISKHLIFAVIASEDGRFFDHMGIDVIEVFKSLKLNLKKGRFARGGSTITQQVVKMAFLSQDKNLIRKAREAVGAILLELLLSKEEIITWYLNMAEFGDGIFGIERASQHYYQSSAQLLTIEQAINLALVLPSPNGWSVGLRHKNLTKFGHKRFRKIVKLMLMQIGRAHV